MKREDFKKIIKLRSVWKIDRRKGNYKLPNGESLSSYISGLVDSQLEIDNLCIGTDGNIYPCSGGKWNNETKAFDDFVIFVPFAENDRVAYDKQNVMRNALVNEIIF